MTVKSAMREAFLTALLDVMERDEKVVFMAADFGSPVVDKIRAKFPDRFINVGIAEQNLINVATGLALEGYTVFAQAIAPFITMRCLEQIRINLALLSQLRPLNVNLIGVGAGYSYVVSGPTHQCLEDISVVRSLPTMQVYSPADPLTAGALAAACHAKTGPKYLRFDAQPLAPVYTQAPDVKKGFHVHGEDGSVVVVATGYMVQTALKLEQPDVIDLFDLTSFDAAALKKELSRYKHIVTLEEGYEGRGGLDALIATFIRENKLPAKMLGIGVTGAYRFELGSRDELHKNVGLDAETLMRRIRDFSS